MEKRGFAPLSFGLILCLAGTQLVAQRNRLSVPIVNENRFRLSGHRPALATPATDQGPAESSLTLGNLTMVLQPSAARQADLEAFLARQQNPSSPDFHRWLKPEEYASRFGVSQSDIDRITTWLGTQDMKVLSVARGRNAIIFSGGVRQVEAAFKTEIHRYLVNGEMHYANTTDPALPGALSGMVTAVRGLHDFKPKARKARYTSGVDGNTHYLTPDDIAAIYNVRPLHNTGIDGAGQKIVIVGQTSVDVADMRQFRNAFNLPPNDPQFILVPGLPDPGVSSLDLSEADLDLEWAGAVARKASLVYVYSQDVTDAVRYAIDQNFAPILSMSYGLCESLTGRADANSLRTMAQQGSAQGITWLAASGDSGAADCWDSTTKTIAVLATDLPASLPEVTGVGGTEFNEGSGAWWRPGNDGNLASAPGYIPEMVWNDSEAAGSPVSGGGGASLYFSKPDWQTGPGVPADGARDVPDVSLAASASHDGYIYYTGGLRKVVGGTSVSTPVLAGMLALLSQYQIANGFQAAQALGNINPQLYAMAVSAPGSFHDITAGDNIVNPCPAKNRSCGTTPLGYSAGPGYDLASGLGSLDVFNLVTAWHVKTGTIRPAAMTLTSNASAIPLSGSAQLTATVTGTGSTPSGTVIWSLGGARLGSATLIPDTAGIASAKLTIPASQLSMGIVAISAAYSGDATFGASAASVSVTVLPPTALTISGATNAASFRQVFAPGMIVAVFGSAMAGSVQSAPLVPLPNQLSGTSVTINGYLSPLYFISPTQINVQIPYYITSGAAVLKVTYNGQSATTQINVTDTAPGIFTNAATGGPVPNESAKRGDTITLFVTGEGSVTPSTVSGNIPSTNATPKPVQALSLTVGGIAATVPFYGVPGWAIGVTQVNYTIPMTAPLGPQPVSVSVGGVVSPAAILNITR
jgi:uncharacterized protein (TIGR03437 family)